MKPTGETNLLRLKEEETKTKTKTCDEMVGYGPRARPRAKKKGSTAGTYDKEDTGVRTPDGKHGFERCQVLAGASRDADDRRRARAMLRCAASLAAHAVMAQRGWLVPTLVEFLPRNQSLLGINVNSGQRIKVRLRSTHGGGFLPFVNILGTLLHELVHNEIGPHNERFYKLLDTLWTEVEALPGYDSIMYEYNNGYFEKEYSGPITRDAGARGAVGSTVAFQGSGHRLGVRNGTPLLASGRSGSGGMREKALAAALARQVAASSSSASSSSGGGHRLGGCIAGTEGLTPAQAAARAAMRRVQDDIACRLGVIEIDGDSEEEDGDGDTRTRSGKGEEEGGKGEETLLNKGGSIPTMSTRKHGLVGAQGAPRTTLSEREENGVIFVGDDDENENVEPGRRLRLSRGKRKADDEQPREVINLC